LLGGCRVISKGAPASPKGYYYFNPSCDFSQIGQVVLVEPDNESSYVEVPADLTEAIFQELQKNQLFSLRIVEQTDTQWQNLDIAIDSAWSLDELFTMQRNFNSDAVIVGTITKYRPFPHLSIGLRLRMVNLSSGELIWGLEQVWDTSNSQTMKRIDHFFKNELRSDYGPLDSKMASVSSLSFFKFVAYEIAQTFEDER